MTTVRDIITDALIRLKVAVASQSVPDDDMIFGLRVFNRMMSGMPNHGVPIQWADVVLGDDWPLEARHEENFTALLAERLANDYGKAVAPEIKRGAVLARQSLRADYALPEPMRVDAALANLPSQRRAWG